MITIWKAKCKSPMGMISSRNKGATGCEIFVKDKWYTVESHMWSEKKSLNERLVRINNGHKVYFVQDELGIRRRLDRGHFNMVFHSAVECRSIKIEDILSSD